MQTMLSLQKPTLSYKDSFIDAVLEFKKENNTSFRSLREYLNYNIGAIQNDFYNTVILPKEKLSKGEDLPQGWVPSQELWILENNSSFLGKIVIRTELPEDTIAGHIGYTLKPSARGKGYMKILLPMALKSARELNISKVLISAFTDNIPSIKSLESLYNTYGIEKVDIVDDGVHQHQAFWFHTYKE
ncbi:MAG: GNAT family N-acetyltransferase [Desulfovibrionaceae bacterium]